MAALTVAKSVERLAVRSAVCWAVLLVASLVEKMAGRKAALKVAW